MSHFTRIKTKMVEKEYLTRALEDLGYKWEAGDLKIGGFLGERARAELKIKVKGRDVGFRKAGDAYEMVADWWGMGAARDQFLQELTRRYAYQAARGQLEAQGFNLVSEEQEKDGRVHLVLRRMV